MGSVSEVSSSGSSGASAGPGDGGPNTSPFGVFVVLDLLNDGLSGSTAVRERPHFSAL
jgi:hypothetical protein